ncbi:DNA translocase FtsK [Terrihalobacillus insolitus]|nr:DNA translocase FtsK [Terrihalobacillus insolitus]MDC3415076.1 DNA translocase FtsK [Terrihalobacillus insolitus]
MKKRVKQLFSSPSEDKRYNQRSTVDKQQEVYTRMAYQYPTERTFTVPDLSDQLERPSLHFEKRRHRQQNEIQDKRVEDKEDIKLTSEIKGKPFHLSEVASPIFGYRDRSQSTLEIDGVPAYLRKNKSRSEQRNTLLQTVDSAIMSENHEKSQNTNNTPKEARKSVRGHHRHVTPLPDRTPTQTDADHQTVRKKKQERQFSLPKNIDVQEQKLQEAILLNQSKNKQLPYNVMMRPNSRRGVQTQSSPPPKREGQVSEIDTDTEVETVPRSEQTPLHLLNDPVQVSLADDTWVEKQTELLNSTLQHFHVKAKVVRAIKGPAVTRFEVQPDLGVKVSKIKNLSDDIKLNLAAKDIRMEAPIPGKNAIGIEVPNPEALPVGLYEIIHSTAFQEDASPLTVALGLDIAGQPIVTNLKKMPHGLIAGATGSGKSVCINTILISLLYKANYEQVKFLLIDPKMVELAPYNDLPHLVSPVITDTKAATAALKWAVNEMEERYEKFVQEGVRDIERYNQKIEKQGRANEHLPYLVIVIDELADLMMVSPQDVEDAICRIAQKARACGIHLLLATQRPSVDVITGLIKANIPTRIAFSVSSQVDSRTIIDASGADKLLGKGDMLFLENGAGQSKRIQGAFVSDDEIERVTSHVKKIAPPNYLFEQTELLKQIDMEEEEDILFPEAVQFVTEQDAASSSLLQRRFKIGYNRAARLIDSMEQFGIVSTQNGSKKRDILMNREQINTFLMDRK